MGLEKIREVLGQLQVDAEQGECWEQLQAALPDVTDDEALVKLMAAARAAHARRGEWGAVAQLLPFELARTAGPGRMSLLMELARVRQQELLDEAGALEAYRLALDSAPDDELLVAAIAESEERSGKWEELAAAYRKEAEGAPDDVYKASMLMRAAEMEWRYAGEARAEERVLGLLAQAAEADPKNTQVLHMLEVVYRRSGKLKALPQLLERWIKSTEEAIAAMAPALRLARLQKNHFQDAAATAQAYEWVLMASPSQPEAIEWLVQYYSEAKDWDRLVQVYERELSQQELNRADKVGDMLQIAMLHYRKRENSSDALVWFERVRAVEPTNGAMLDFYRDYCTRTGSEGLLLQVLQQAQRVLPSGDQKNSVTQEIAKLAEGQEDAQKAIEQYQALLRGDPDNSEAREALKALYRKTQGYNQLVDLLQHQLERTPEQQKEERLGILREVAAVYREHVPNETSLVSALNQILRLDERSAETVRELITLYERLERWRDLLTNQQRLAAMSDDPQERAQLLRDSGRRWLQQFSNVQNATLALEALLEIVPDDREARDTLANLYKKRRAWPALYKLYESQLAALDGAQRVAVMKEMAELAAERLGKRDTAATLYKSILEQEPNNLEVLDALEKQAERARDWPTLAEALERRAAAPIDLNAKISVLQKLGSVCADHLKDSARAVAAWNRVLELQPGHARALRVLRDAYLESKEYDQLERLYRSQSDFETLAEVLSTTADKVADIRSKIDLSYRAARVFEQDLEKPERAFRCYERIMAADPLDVRAAGALLPLYERDEKWARLPPLYELLIGDSKSEDERLSLYSRLVQVTADRLNDKAASVAFARRAYEFAPERPESLELFERACAKGDNWQPYVEAIEARLKRHRESVTPPPKGGRRRRRGSKAKEPEAQSASGQDALTPETVLRLEMKLAATYDEKLRRIDDAIGVYRRLLESQPDNLVAGERLEELLIREQRPDDLRWLMGLRVENASSDDTELELMKQWAALEEKSFSDSARAAELYRRIVEQHPKDTDALSECARLLLAIGETADAVKAVEQHRDLVDTDEKARLETELAQLYLTGLDQPAEALDAAIRAIESGSEAESVVEVLRQLSERPQTKLRASEVLAEVYRRSGENRREADALLSLLAAEEDPRRRLELYIRAVGVLEQLDSYGAAFETMLKACREFPSRVELWDRATLSSEQAGRPTELADAYREVLQADLSPDVQRELCGRAAILHTDQLGDPVGATPYLEKVLSLDPGNQDAFLQLKQILTSNQRWGELQSLYERTAAAIDDPVAKVEILAEVAMVSEEFMDDSLVALKYYESMLALDPEQPAALEALDRLYTRHARHEPLEALLERRLALESDPGRAIQFQLRLADLELTQLHQPDRALPNLSAVIEQDLGNKKARELLERVLEIGSLRGPAAALLERVYEQRDEVRDLVRVLDLRLAVLRQAEPQPDDFAHAERELLHRLAELRNNRLRDDEAAFGTYSEYLVRAPGDEAARGALLAIGARLGRHEEAAVVLDEAGQNIEDPLLQGELWLEAAQLRNGPLGQPEQAEGLFRKVLSVSVDSPHLAKPAARALEGIYTARDDAAELVANLRIQLELADDAEERSSMLGRIARLCEARLEDAGGAIAAWRERLEAEPTDLEALAALDRLYEAGQKWPALVEVLEQRRDVSEDDSTRKGFCARLANLLAEKIGDRALAIDTYRAMLSEFGPDAGVLNPLELLLRAAQRWDELVEAYEVHLELDLAQEERLQLQVSIADLRRQELSNPAAALELYQQVVSVDPAHPAARKALHDLMSGEDRLNRREAAEILDPLYETSGEYDDLLGTLEVLIETADDPDDKLRYLERAARVADGDLHQPARALAFVRTAVSAAAGHTDLRNWLTELERLSSVAGERKAQSELLRSIVGDIFDGDVQFDVTFRIAEIARDDDGDDEQALQYFARAAELRADSDAALAALQALHTKHERFEELLRVLEQRTELPHPGVDRRELMFQRAELLEGQLEQPGRAIAVLESLLDGPFDGEAAERLVHLYTSERRWEQLVDLYSRELEGPSADVAGLRVKIAQVSATQLGDTFRAFEQLEEALSVHPQHAGAVEELERLMNGPGDSEQHSKAAAILEPIYLARADFDKVMVTLDARLEHADDPDERRHLLHSLAQLYEEQKEDFSAAFETTARLLSEGLESDNTIAELERLARVADKSERLAAVYAAQLESGESSEEHRRIMARRAGELFRDLGQLEQALAHFRLAYDFDREERALFEAVDELLSRLERHSERVELYREALDYRFEAMERLHLLHTIADLLATRLDQKQDAINTYIEALGVDPEDATSLDTLSRLYYETERYEDLYELVLARAQAAPNQRRAAVYRLALAQLCRDQLKDKERAIEQLQEIVSVDPSHAEATAELEEFRKDPETCARAIEILLPLYEHLDQWRHVIKLNEDRFRLAETPEEKVAVLRETASLWENRGSEPKKALVGLAQAVKLTVEDDALRTEYQRLVEFTNAWDELAELYAKLLRREPDNAAARDMWLTLARCHDESRDDPRAALEAYSELHKLDNSDLDVVERMEALATLLSDWETLDTVLESKAELVFDDEQRASIMRRIGEGRRDMLDRRDGAIEAYERALEFEPDSAFTVDCLIELYGLVKNADRLVELYQRRVELTDPEERDTRFENLVLAAKCYERDFQDRIRAIDLFNQALEEHPNEPSTLEQLGELYAAESQWPELLDNLSVRVSIAETAERRAALNAQRGDTLSQKLESFEEALEAYELVLQEAPDDVEARRKTRSIGEQHEELRERMATILLPALERVGANREITEVLELRLTAETEPMVRAQTLRAIARTFEAELKDQEGAHSALLRAMSEVPEDDAIHSELQRLSAADGRWAAYAEALAERALNTFDTELAKDLYVRLGAIAEANLDSPEQAIDAYRKAMDQVGDLPELLSTLDRLYTKQKMWADLLDILERRSVAVEADAERGELFQRLGLLQVDEFSEVGPGLESLRTALELDPTLSQASAKLEELLERGDLFEEAAEILETAYRSRGDVERLTALSEKRVDNAQTPGERIDMRKNLARVLEEEMTDTPNAQRVLQQGLKEDPSDDGLLSELERLAHITGDWASAATALLAAIELRDELPAETRRDLSVRAGEWFSDHIDDAEAAERAFETAFLYDKTSEDVLLRLEAIQSLPGRERARVGTLRRRAALQYDEQVREELYREAKQLADSVADAALTEQVVRELLEHDESNRWALSQLAELREAAQDWEETFGLLLRLCDVVVDGEALIDNRHHAARIAREHLGEKSKAVELYEQVLEQEPSDSKATEALRVLYPELERFDELAALLTTMAEASEDVAERTSLRLELAELHQTRFSSADDAILVLSEILHDDPQNSDAVVLLSRLFEENGRFEDLAELLTTQTQSADDRGDLESAVRFETRLAEVYETRLNDPTRAIETHARVLQRDPGYAPALDALARLNLAGGNRGAAIDALARRVELSSGDEQLKFAKELARVQIEGDRISDGVQTLEYCLSLDAADIETRDSLRQLYRDQQSWLNLANLIAGDADFESEAASQIKLLSEAADLLRERAAQPERAAAILERAVELKSDDRGLLLTLCELYNECGRSADAIRTLEQIVESYGGRRSKELGDIHRRLSDAYQSQGDTARAIEELDRAFRIEPGNVAVLRALGILSLESDDLKRAQQMFRALLLQKLDDKSPITKPEVHYHLALVHHKMNEDDKAKQFLNRALQNEPNLIEARELLEKLS